MYKFPLGKIHRQVFPEYNRRRRATKLEKTFNQISVGWRVFSLYPDLCITSCSNTMCQDFAYHISLKTRVKLLQNLGSCL